MTIEAAQKRASARRTAFESIPPHLRTMLDELRREWMKSGHDAQYRELRDALIKAHGRENS